jgi:polyketide cyclase/dehydrase/lipid transport protein
LKLIIASLIVFSIVILFLFALFPSDISVSRLIQIRASPQEVQKKISDLTDWRSWNEMLITHPDSNNKLSIEVLKVAGDTVITQWKNGRKSFTGTYIMTEMNGETVLEWTLKFHIKWYPWEKLASMFYDKQLGPVMENSLLKLRNELEAK